MALTFSNPQIVTETDFADAWPELEPLTGILYNIRYAITDKLFCGFSGIEDEECRCILMLLALAHVQSRLCEPDLVNPLKELRSMESAEKYEVFKRDYFDLDLVESVYGRMLLDYANLDYQGGMGVSFREQGCYTCFR